MTIFTFFVYGATGFNFPKYYAPALPLMSIFIVFMLKEIKFKIGKSYWTYSILFIILAVYSVFLLGDPIIPEISSTVNTLAISAAIVALSKNFLLYFIVPLLISYIFVFRLKMKNKFFIGLIILILFFYIYIGIIQATANYSTHHQYGIFGTEEVANYFKKQGINSKSVATYPAVGYYIGYNKYYDLTFVYNDKQRLDEFVLENEEVEYIVMFEKDFDRIGRENLRDFEEEEVFGNYFVLKRIE